MIAGVLAEECTDLNLIFNHWITTNSPLFAAKSGVTLDGKVATRTGGLEVDHRGGGPRERTHLAPVFPGDRGRRPGRCAPTTRGSRPASTAWNGVRGRFVFDACCAR